MSDVRASLNEARKGACVVEFRRFTNALAKRGAREKWWLFTADRRAGILLVAVNIAHSPAKANALEALVRDWGGEVHIHE